VATVDFTFLHTRGSSQHSLRSGVGRILNLFSEWQQLIYHLQNVIERMERNPHCWPSGIWSRRICTQTLISRLITPSTNQSINQSINQSFDQSSSQSRLIIEASFSQYKRQSNSQLGWRDKKAGKFTRTRETTRTCHARGAPTHECVFRYTHASLALVCVLCAPVFCPSP